MKPYLILAVSASLLGANHRCEAAGTPGVTVTTERIDSDEASAGWELTTLPRPTRNDAASNAVFSILSGKSDPNGADLSVLHDGKVPTEDDAPGANFFFAAGTDGGQILVDLGTPIDIKEVNTYSWHGGTRGPQVYDLYVSDGQAANFKSHPAKEDTLEACGWKRLAQIDTRPTNGESGGQYGVSISNAPGSIGTNRYLLFNIARTEDRDGFGNTFLSEIDVIDRNGPAPEAVATSHSEGIREIVETGDGKYKIVIDTSETPDLTDWAHKEIAPMVQEWYPKLLQMLPS